MHKIFKILLLSLLLISCTPSVHLKVYEQRLDNSNDVVLTFQYLRKELYKLDNDSLHTEIISKNLKDSVINRRTRDFMNYAHKDGLRITIDIKQ